MNYAISVLRDKASVHYSTLRTLIKQAGSYSPENMPLNFKLNIEAEEKKINEIEEAIDVLKRHAVGEDDE